MDPLGIRGVPFMARRNYYFEVIHLVPWSLLAGMIEGNIASIVVAKTFHGSSLLIATASATPIGALLFSLGWGMMCVGRPKLRLATIFGGAAALCTATVFLTPRSPHAGMIFVAQMAAAQVFLAGVVTVRAALWRSNYPPEARGRIASRLYAVRMIISIGALIGASVLFDYDADLYRYVYLAAAVCGLIALVILQRVHVRHERAELRRINDLPAVHTAHESGRAKPRRASDAATGSAGDLAPNASPAARRVSIAAALSPRRVLAETFTVLREDPRFTRYLWAQALLGSGMQIVLPVVVIILDANWHLFWTSVVIIEVLPKLAMFGSLGRWGHLFDRIGVLRLRVLNGTCAAVGSLFGMLATLFVVHQDSVLATWALPAAAILFAGRGITQGLARGGGALAWNLGHLHFAKREKADVYMGVHVSFTGVRGLITPFVGIALWHLLGWGVWAVSALICAAGVLMFQQLARSDSLRGDPV